MDAAFSFCNEPRYDTFSLNELAARVGISKPAIYRHFKDKDALLAAMHERFADELAGCLLGIQAAREQHGDAVPHDRFAHIIQFFTDNCHYVNYAIGALSAQDGFERQITEELRARGVKNLIGCESDDATGAITVSDFDRYVQAIYCGVTIFIFIKLRERMLGEGLAVTGTDDFAAKLVRLMTRGLARTVAADSVLYPAAISEARLNELDALCAVQDGDLAPQDRIFTALAAVISRYKMTGVTVERIADELHMAKSSLYEYFANKNEMIKTLILRELALLDTMIKENAAEARNFSEYIYIHLETEYAYLRLRPELIPICGWLLMSTAEQPFTRSFESTNPWQKRLPPLLEEPDLGLALTSEDFISWLGALPVALVVQCIHRDLGDETLQQAVRALFRFIEQGIEPEAQSAL